MEKPESKFKPWPKPKPQVIASNVEGGEPVVIPIKPSIKKMELFFEEKFSRDKRIPHIKNTIKGEDMFVLNIILHREGCEDIELFGIEEDVFIEFAESVTIMYI